MNQSYLKDGSGSSDIKVRNPCLNAFVQGDSWVTNITLGGIEDKLRRPNNSSLKRLSFVCLFHKISKVSMEIKCMAWNFIVKSSTNSALDNTTVQTIHPLLTWQKHVNVVFPPVQRGLCWKLYQGNSFHIPGSHSRGVTVFSGLPCRYCLTGPPLGVRDLPQKIFNM